MLVRKLRTLILVIMMKLAQVFNNSKDSCENPSKFPSNVASTGRKETVNVCLHVLMFTHEKDSELIAGMLGMSQH